MNTNIEQVEALFLRALECPLEDRAAFLANVCSQDSVLLARLQHLLRAHETSGDLLPEQPRSGGVTSSLAEKPGDLIGPYKLLEQIGEGGCGVVYMAQQQQSVRRLVALKVIKLGMDTRNVVARFEAERQALALMDHPNIAKVLDAGTTQAGRPYFVMELVRGVRITDHCEQHHLSTPQRLELVLQACRAIQHAHQKGIIHRDIKPSNVLVTVQDGLAVPKVIDFGIAKAIQGRLTDHTLFTAFEQFIGTPAYTSPEQAKLNGLDIDTRTDIYSLGVLLYELLTGRPPFDVRELLAASLEEMQRTIREREPPRPSTRLALELAQPEFTKLKGELVSPDMGAEVPDTGLAEDRKSRIAQNKQLIDALRGDLDWIVMKCLEKDRTRRYETANGLAMDLQRYLKGEAVLARPPANWYRFQKLVRRNKLLFAATAAVAGALVLGTIGSTLEAFRARKAERAQSLFRAEADEARAGEATQRAAAERHLYNALLGEARAKALTGGVGQRFESLDAISKAAAIRSTTELCDAAVAAFALPDLRELKRWRFPSHWIAENICFDQPLELYVYRTLSGMSVRRLKDDQEIAFLSVNDVEDMSGGLLPHCFDGQSRYFAASCLTRSEGRRCRVWDLARGGVLALDVPSIGNPDFTPDGHAIGIVNADNTVSVKEIASGLDLKRFSVDPGPDVLSFSPDGKTLGCLLRGSLMVRLIDVDSGQMLNSLLSTGAINIFAWNHDGTLVATGGEDGEIRIWDSLSCRSLRSMEGHEKRVTVLAFSHQGDLLASEGWDSTLRLWDVARGRQLLIERTQDTDLHFSPDDRTLAYAVEGETTKLLEVAHTPGYRRLVGSGEPRKSWNGAFSPDGRLLAVCTKGGIDLWDVVAGKELGVLQTAACHAANFQTNGGLSLAASTTAGLYRWPLDIQSNQDGQPFLRVGVPQILLPGQDLRYCSQDRAGGKLVVTSSYQGAPLMIDLANPTNTVSLRGQPGAEFVALAPGGRWAATSAWKGRGVKVYECSTGRPVRDLPGAGTSLVAFSPDDHWLATANMTELKLWKTGSWEAQPRRLAGDQVSEINPLTFSPDGGLLAVVRAASEIQLLKVPSLESVARLKAPTFAQIGAICFNPAGNQLAVIEWNGQVDLWDLPIIRDELKKLNLGWRIPPFTPAKEAARVAVSALPMDAGPFSRKELAQTIGPRNPNAAANLIDLTAYYNAPLTESWHSPKEARNSLSELQPGVRTFGGVEFDVRGLIQIGTVAASGLSYPSHIHGIPIRRQCRRLHFLQAAIFSADARPGDELGSYVFHYADGREIERPIVVGRDTGEWWSQPNQPNLRANVAWNGTNPAAQADGHTIRLFSSTWENPYPEATITRFDFVSDRPTPGAPFLVAVTAEP